MDFIKEHYILILILLAFITQFFVNNFSHITAFLLGLVPLFVLILAMTIIGFLLYRSIK